ncbi:MAG TPA: DUF61 family protein [Archaeoglobaceae archaeon]|nr:DUF61 family protein [Archaeoglobaceae archaeon]
MISDRTLAKMIEAINKHMPAKSKTLSEMLKEDEPTIKAKDGNEYLIEKKEIEFIAKYVDELDWSRFNLPVILEMCDIHGEIVVFVRDKMHAEFIEKAFGYNRYTDGILSLYLYEMGPIRRKLKTASQVMFRVTR